MQFTASKTIQRWTIAWWILFVVWVGCAILGMGRIPASLFTSYGADLTLPAWLYITARELHRPNQATRLFRLVGKTPLRAALLIFGASTFSEVSQYFWPHGPFSGFFDVYDIGAYALGTGLCYFFDISTDGKAVSESA